MLFFLEIIKKWRKKKYIFHQLFTWARLSQWAASISRRLTSRTLTSSRIIDIVISLFIFGLEPLRVFTSSDRSILILKAIFFPLRRHTNVTTCANRVNVSALFLRLLWEHPVEWEPRWCFFSRFCGPLEDLCQACWRGSYDGCDDDDDDENECDDWNGILDHPDAPQRPNPNWAARRNPLGTISDQWRICCRLDIRNFLNPFDEQDRSRV